MLDVHLPGDIVQLKSLEDKKTRVIGCGLERIAGNPEELLVVQPGISRVENVKQWISVHSKRYIAEAGDRVLGIGTATHSDVLRFDIGAAEIAFIHFMSFDGATKKNRPNLKTGDIIYATVAVASKHLEPELTCIDNEGRARGLGPLPPGGFLFRTSLNLVRRLLSPQSSLLSLLGKDLKFEVACGVNGRIWLKGSTVQETVAIYQLIKESELVAEPDIRAFVENGIRKLRGFPVDESETEGAQMDSSNGNASKVEEVVAVVPEKSEQGMQELSSLIQGVLQQTQDRFQRMSDQIVGRIDDMTQRIDDLEKNISELMTQAGIEPEA